MKKIVTVLFFLGFYISGHSQSPTQNCMGAIPICQNIYTQSSPYLGVGTMNELNGSNQGCLTTGESNSVWYIFNTATAGSLVFTITPLGAPASDYDVAVWDLTDKSCNAIAAGLQPIRCNYASLANSVAGGLTGLSSSYSNPSNGAAGPSFSSAINAFSGQTFVILINNSGGSSNGYSINFSGSTSQILDNVAPFIKSDTISTSCSGPSSMKVLLSENVICSSFVGNGTDFLLSPAAASIVNAVSASCNAGGAYSNLFTVNFSSPLPPGNYTLSSVIGSDGNTLIDNCGNAMPVGTSIPFTVSPPLQANVSMQFGCAGTPSGVITATNIGGTSPFTYKLNTGGYTSNNVFSGLLPGTYTVTVKDNNGCEADTVINLIQGPAIHIVSAAITNIICYGANTGVVTITANGGTPPLSYSVGVLPYSTNNTISALSPGNHLVHVKDVNGCIKDTVIFISSPGQLTINSLLLTNATCAATNGSIVINAFGGAPLLTYSLNSGAFQTSTSFTGLSAGVYNVHIKDANGCTKDTVVTISQISQVAVSSLSLVQPGCSGNTGSIGINGIGGTLPYTYSINGILFSTSNSFPLLSSGSYTVVVKDATGCSATSATILNSPSGLFFGNAAVVNPTCLLQGSISVSGIGGAAPYLFSLATGPYSAISTFTPLVSGSYIVHIKDNNGCVHDTTIVLNNLLSPVISNLTTISPSCSYPAIGSIVVYATGGVSPLLYSLNGSPFAGASSFTGLTGGTYTVVIKDANACTQSSIIALTAINTIVFTSFSHTNVGCNGSPLGSVTSLAGNGNGPYQYNMNGGLFQASANFNSLNGGTYTVIAKDASGCTKSSVVVITSSTTLAINTVSITPSSCFNPPTGIISVSGIGSALPVTYSLNSATGTSSGLYSPLSPGTYTVSINDANGCHKDSVVTVPGPPPMNFANVFILYTPCQGGSGSISLQGAGGTPSYTYSINGGPFSTPSNWPVLTAGTYSIQLKDANGCLHDTAIILYQPPAVNFTSVVIFNPSCIGTPIGSISVLASGSYPPFQYSINGVSSGTVSTFNGLGAGSYTIHVTDAIGCGGDTTIQLTNTGNFTINSIVKNKPSCFGGNNGSITMTGNGGTAPYLYALNTGAFSTVNTFSNLTAGTYTLHAKDNAGCFKDSVVVLVQPSSVLYSSIVLTPATCYGAANASVIVTASGGTPLYQCKIDGGIYGPSGIFSNLTGGIHTLTLKDSKGCIRDSLISIAQPPALYFTNVTAVNPGCMGTIGLITVHGTGGTSPYLFAIGSGSYVSIGSFTNLPAGTFTIHVKDNNNCVHDTIITLSNNLQITVNSVTKTPLLCLSDNSGTITINASSSHPPVSYSSNGGTPQLSGNFTGLLPGTYSIHIQDQIGCFVDSLVTILAAPPIQINNIILTPPLCHASNNGSIIINAIGGAGPLRFSLNVGSYTPANSFSNLIGGTYTVHIKDSISCQRDTVLNLTAPPALYFTSINVVQPYCTNATDGKITINAAGGQAPYQYAINTSLFTTNNLFQNLFQGTYTIHVKDYNNCTYDSVVSLTSANYMDFSNVVITNVSCKFGNDGSISLNVIGGYNPYNFTINSVATGTTSFFGNLGVGSYTVVVTDVLGCAADTVLAVNEPASPLESIILNVTPNLCRGDSIGTITSSATGGSLPYTYSLDGATFFPSSFFTGLMAGVYSITVKDNQGCLDDTVAVVIEPDTSLQMLLIGVKDVSCWNVNDGAITITSKYGSDPLHYYLNGTLVGLDTFYNNLIPGDYIVEVRDALGCKSTGKYNVKPSDRRPYIIIDSLQGVLCEGDKNGSIDWHTINTFPQYYYTFDSVYIGTASYMGGISNGTYTIQVTDSIGCYADTTISIIAEDRLDLNVVSSPASCQGRGDDGKATATVDGGVGPFRFTWSGSIGNSNNQAFNLWYGPQVAFVEDDLGCIDTAHFEVPYDPCCMVNLPNAFSPNGDGVNDIFKVIKYGLITIVSFEVYNRWGNRVFGTTTEDDGWNGKYMGSDCDLDVYYYLLRYRCHLKNEIIMMKGDITLIR